MPERPSFPPPRVESPSSDQDEKPDKDERARLLEQARSGFRDFHATFEKTVNAYYGTPDMSFTMKPGGWYINLEKIEVNADPSFFLDQGFSESESLFATFHEAEHFRDMLQDPDAYNRHFQYVKSRTDVHAGYPKALFRMYNCLDDVLVNRVVMNRWKDGARAKDSVYPKLFGTHDFRTAGDPPAPVPRHRQLMYALLRGAMLPDEKPLVDPDVQDAIDAWQQHGGRMNALDSLTAVDPKGLARYKPEQRFYIIRGTLEPVFEELYKRDLDDRKSKKTAEGEPGEPGEPGEEGEPFGDDPFDNAIPDPMDYEDLLDQINKIIKAIKKKKVDEFKERMGVDQKDFEAYRKDYDIVQPHIEALATVFEDVIQRRTSYRRRLIRPVKEGPVLDPRKAATAVAEIKAGHYEPVVMLDYEKKEVLRHLPNQLEFTLVCDGSGSMSGNPKEVMQRRLAVLATEAFALFQEKIQQARRHGEHIQLDVRSEVREFSDSDTELKPLSPTLTHAERVAMHKALKKLPSGGNNEAATFDAIEGEQYGPARLKRLRTGELKKLVVWLTDGGTDKSVVQGRLRRHEQLAGITKQGTSNLVIAGIGFDEGREAQDVYAPNGYYANTFEDVPKIFTEIIAKVLEDV